MYKASQLLLFVVNHSDFFISHRLPIALQALEKGYDVHVATGESPAAAKLAAYGITWHPLPLEPGGMNPLNDLSLLIHLHLLYSKLKPDIVHHVTIKPVLYGGIVSRFQKVHRVVNALSGLGYLFMSSGKRITLLRHVIAKLLKYSLNNPRSVLILQNNDDISEFAKRKLIDPARIRLIRGSGADLDKFAFSEETNHTPLIVLPARLLWDKGIASFVGAARLLKTRGFKARFALVGGPDENNPTSVPQEQLDAWVEEGLVEVWGHRSDMPNILTEAHIVCLPSFREGLPKVLIEASGCGRPLIATDVPGCREIVQDGENGILVPAKNAERLADAIAILLADKTLRQRMGKRAREIAEEGFAVQKVIQQTLQLYE